MHNRCMKLPCEESAQGRGAPACLPAWRPQEDAHACEPPGWPRPSELSSVAAQSLPQQDGHQAPSAPACRARGCHEGVGWGLLHLPQSPRRRPGRIREARCAVPGRTTAARGAGSNPLAQAAGHPQPHQGVQKQTPAMPVGTCPGSSGAAHSRGWRGATDPRGPAMPLPAPP